MEACRGCMEKRGRVIRDSLSIFGRSIFGKPTNHLATNMREGQWVLRTSPQTGPVQLTGLCTASIAGSSNSSTRETEPRSNSMQMFPGWNEGAFDFRHTLIRRERPGDRILLRKRLGARHVSRRYSLTRKGRAWISISTTIQSALAGGGTHINDDSRMRPRRIDKRNRSDLRGAKDTES